MLPATCRGWESGRAGDPDAHWLPDPAGRRRALDFAQRSGATRSVGYPRARRSRWCSSHFNPAFPQRSWKWKNRGDRTKQWHGRRAPLPPPTSRPLPSSSCSFLAVPCQTHQQL